MKSGSKTGTCSRGTKHGGPRKSDATCLERYGITFEGYGTAAARKAALEKNCISSIKGAYDGALRQWGVSQFAVFVVQQQH